MGQLHAVFGGNLVLTLFDHVIMKLDDPATVEADQVVVVILMSQLEHGFAPFEVMTGDDTGIIKLVEHPIDGSQTNLLALLQQQLVELFGAIPGSAGIRGS